MDWWSNDETRHQHIFREIFQAFVTSMAFAWGLYMLGTSPIRAIAIALVVCFLIISGVGWRRLQQLCLASFFAGLMLWAHIPLVDRLVERLQNLAP